MRKVRKSEDKIEQCPRCGRPLELPKEGVDQGCLAGIVVEFALWTTFLLLTGFLYHVIGTLWIFVIALMLVGAGFAWKEHNAVIRCKACGAKVPKKSLR